MNPALRTGMDKAPQHHVYFAVFGFGDYPGVVTRAMGMEPTKAWIEGEPMGTRKIHHHTHSRWVLQSTLPIADPIDAHLENLLSRLERRREAVAEICTRFEAHIAVAAYWHEVNPGFCLSASIIQRIAALGLEVDFDLYCLAGDPGS